VNITNEKLARNGGTPVRTQPLPAAYLGTSVLGSEELELLTEVIQTKLPFRAYGDGNPHMVDDFEALACEYFDMPYALATATGSGSFFCAMAGLGIGPGDEVIIPSFAWNTDFMAPVLFGAVPVFADINKSLCMDPDDFERKISPKTKAVIVVHFQGASNDFDRIIEIAQKHNIKVVEDVAQACGAEYKGKKLGSLSDVSCFSFQQNKIMTTGDGGMLLAKDPEVFERAVRFHDLGHVRESFGEQLNNDLKIEPFAGCQFRMNEFTGAVALAQLRKLNSHILGPTRKMFHDIKAKVAANCPGIKFRQTGDDSGDAGISFYVDLETQERSSWFEKSLLAEGVRVGPPTGSSNMIKQIYVQHKNMVHPSLPPFGQGHDGENVEYKVESCPNTDSIISSMQCVAIVPMMSDQDANDVANAIIKVWNQIPQGL